MRAVRFLIIPMVVSALFAVDSSAQTGRGSIEGNWRLEESRWDDEIQMRFMYRAARHGSSNMGMTIELSELDGLDEEDIERRERTEVSFRMERDAGAVVFEGDIRRGAGRGDFVFTPSSDYIAAMGDLGFRRLRDHEVFQFALHDVSLDMVRELQDMGFRRMDTDDLISAAIFEVTPEYIREMRDAGHDGVRLDELVQFRIFDVDPGFIADFAAAGYDYLTADELVQAKIHGVTPEYAGEMNSNRRRRVSFDDLVQSRIFSVDPDFINDMLAIGLDLDLEDAFQFRIHGVTKSFVRGMLEIDFDELVPDDFVTMRIHGIDLAWVSDMVEEFEDIDVDALVDIRIHGRYGYQGRRDRSHRRERAADRSRRGRTR